jgi:hypothetical protein
MNQFEVLKNGGGGTLHPEVGRNYSFGVVLAHRLMKAKKEMLECIQGNVKDGKWEIKYP